jgi:hypothetical protein
METLRQIAWLVAIALGFLGLLLIGYALVADRMPWPPLEESSDSLASASTLVAVAVVALVAYLPENYTPIKDITRHVTAPLVLLLTAYLAYRWWKRRRPMSPMLVNGVSLLALSGGLLRLIPSNGI